MEVSLMITKGRILVIDDDPLLLHTVKSLLGKRGFNVLISSSAPKGLDMLRYAAGDRCGQLQHQTVLLQPRREGKMIFCSLAPATNAVHTLLLRCRRGCYCGTVAELKELPWSRCSAGLPF